MMHLCTVLTAVVVFPGASNKTVIVSQELSLLSRNGRGTFFLPWPRALRALFVGVTIVLSLQFKAIIVLLFPNIIL